MALEIWRQIWQEIQFRVELLGEVFPAIFASIFPTPYSGHSGGHFVRIWRQIWRKYGGKTLEIMGLRVCLHADFLDNVFSTRRLTGVRKSGRSVSAGRFETSQKNRPSGVES